jgi:CHAT domain-containing protein
LGTNGVVETTGTGLIELIGTGGNGTDGNFGILLSGPASSVSSVNGNISLTGTGRGIGDGNHGIFSGGVVQSIGAGSITLTGTSNATGNNNDGVSIFQGGAVKATGTGNITFNGRASGVTDNQGIAIGGLAPGLTNAKVSSVNGSINLIGTGAGNQIGIFDNHGILIYSSGVVESTGTGAITLEGTGANGAAGIRLSNNASINPTGIGSGTITLTADELDIDDTSQIKGIGILQLQTLDPNLGISVGGTTNDARLNLDTSELNTLQNGFSQIFIGTADSSGAVTLTGNTTFNDPITLRSPTSNGSINTTGFTLTGADNATITLLANQDISTGNIINRGRQITITSNSGNINTTAGILDTSSLTANAGAIALKANGNILTNDLNAASNALSGDGGNITLDTNQNITTGNLFSASSNSKGGEIRLSSGGVVSTGNLVSSSPKGSGGDINLQANGDITTGQIFSDAAKNGGTISLTSGGAITVISLDSSGATGGFITIDASTAITTGTINSSGTTGKGGNVTLDPSGDIQVSSINAQGGTQGGAVDITTGGFFRATDTFQAANGQIASISTVGGNGGGDITIRHGGNGVTPFIVGDASLNGTAGAITSGDFAIAPVQSFPYTYRQGNIQIISVPAPNPSPTPTPSPSPTPTPSPSPILSFEPTDFNLPSTQLATPSALGEFPSVTVDPIVAQLEETFTSTYQNYLGESNTSNSTTQTVSLPEAQFQLQQIEKATGIKPALIYAFFAPTSLPSETPAAGISCHPNPVGASCPSRLQQRNLHQSASPTANLKSQPEKSHEPPQIFGQFNSSELTTSTEPTSPQPNSAQDNDQLELVLVTSSGKPIQRRVTGATRKLVLEMADKLRAEITNPIKQRSTSYLPPAQQLYQWLVTPLEQDLRAEQINNLVFIMDVGLRSVPLAALHNGSGFIVERYSVGLMPSVSLTDTHYVNVKNTQVLAMGASTFTQQKPLPATSTELSVIAEQLWSGKLFLNDAFTLDNLKGARAAQPFGIIHLATHANFQPGKPSNSYIQLWGDDKLQLDQLSQLGWNNPPVELLVLSACRTALGDEEAELGFTGLATLSGVKTALGSLWHVSDEGTLGLMSEFYEQLKEAPIKAEALRQAQLAMIQGKVRLEGGKLITTQGSFLLPPELVAQGDKNLSHPYFWSGFSMIGNPW